jgi:hypothetical protein
MATRNTALTTDMKGADVNAPLDFSALPTKTALFSGTTEEVVGLVITVVVLLASGAAKLA